MKKLLLLLPAIALMAACNNMNNMKNDHSADKAKVMRFYEEVINAHNPDAVDSFVTADFVDHQPNPGHSGKGIPDLKAQFKDFFTAFPDVHLTPEMVVEQGDTFAIKVHFTGTNSGSMGPGMPATNKKVDVEGMDFLVIKDGKATERWGYSEEMKMMHELGMIPDHEAGMDSSKMMMDHKMMEKEKMEGKKK
jgi:predicted ester cyclase